MIEFAMLRVIWWVLLGILFIGFAIMDGFDLGVAALSPWVARNETERRIVLNSIGPVWEGNQVWIILAAGAIFAAWPLVYAVAFSGAYFVVLLLLLTMGISRPVSFKYRSKLPSHFWRRFWDWGVFIGGFVPAIVFGILVGNLLLGLPFYFDNNLHITYTGKLLELFQPFALWCGLTGLLMLTMHGGLYLAIKTNAPICDRAISASKISSLLLIICFAVGGFWVAKNVMGYQVVSGIDPNGYSNPLHKEISTGMGSWLINYTSYPLTKLVPTLGFLGALLAYILASIRFLRLAFIASSISIIGIIGTVGVSMFPFILPSSTNLTSSLLVWDASSSYMTLMVMLASVVVFLPIVLIYTTWVYHVMRGKVSSATIEKDNNHVAY